MYLIWTNERYSGDPSIEPTLTAKVDKFLYEKGVYTRIDQKIIENLEDLGCAKIKGERKGSDARKLEGRE